MKVKSITVRNFKAVSDQDMDFNGSSAIITGGNNKGKSSVLRGLIDRFRGEKPEIIVKEGEEKGFNTMELTDGSKIVWNFTKRGENFSFITSDDIKMTTGVLSAIGEKYFGIQFDIDKFMRSSKKEAKKMVQILLGIDLTDLESRYKSIFDQRTDVNREVKRLQNLNKVKPEPVERIDVQALRDKKDEIKSHNDGLRNKWAKENEEYQGEIMKFNAEQNDLSSKIDFFANAQLNLQKYKESHISNYIDFEAIRKAGDELPEPKPIKPMDRLDEPDYKDTQEIDLEIERAIQVNFESGAYETQLKEYNDWVNEGKKAVDDSEKLTKQLNDILLEKTEILKKANIPQEFEITDDGILYNGLPLDNNQISSSAKYIAALKLGALGLGKLRTMHFDASYLDKNSLGDIEKWANDNDLQLLIEKPDWDGGEIEYKILEQ